MANKNKALGKKLDTYSLSARTLLKSSKGNIDPKRLFTYSAAGTMAMAAITCSATNANAIVSVTTSTITHVVNATYGTGTWAFDIDGSGGWDVRFNNITATTGSCCLDPVFITASLSGWIAASYATSPFTAIKLTQSVTFPGTVSYVPISGLNPVLLAGYNATFSTTQGNFHDSRGLVPFLFKSNADGLNHYGFMDVGTTFLGASYSFTLYGWGYQVAPVPAGVHVANITPEPTSLALLALGAGGIAAWRRKRKKAA